MMRRSSMPLLILALPFLTAAPAFAQAKSKKDAAGEKKSEGKKQDPKKAEKKKGPTYELNTQGTLGAPAKGSPDVYEFTYTESDGKKPVKKQAWVKIDASTKLLRDRQADLKEFKEGEALMVFGKPVARDSGGKGYVGGKTYLMQASRVVLGGKELSVNDAYKDAKDDKFQWCEATIEKPGQAVTLSYSGASYKLTLDKGAGVFMRSDGEVKRDIKKGAHLVVKGNSVAEKVEGDDKGLTVFQAAEVIAMEPRLLQWYGALLP